MIYDIVNGYFYIYSIKIMFRQPNFALTNRGVKRNAHNIKMLDRRIDALNGENVIVFEPTNDIKYLVSAYGSAVLRDALFARSSLKHVNSIDKITVFGEACADIVSSTNNRVFGTNTFGDGVNVLISSINIESITPLTELVNTTTNLMNKEGEPRTPNPTTQSFRFVTESESSSKSVGGKAGSVDIELQNIYAELYTDNWDNKYNGFVVNNSFLSEIGVGDDTVNQYTTKYDDTSRRVYHFGNDAVLDNILLYVRTGDELQNVNRVTVRYE